MIKIAFSMAPSRVRVLPYQRRLRRANSRSCRARSSLASTPMTPCGLTCNIQEQRYFSCTNGDSKIMRGSKLAARGPHALMVGRAGLDGGVRHGEGLEHAPHLAVVMQLAHVVIVGVDDPARGVGLSDAVEGADLRFDGRPAINRRNALGFALEIGIEFKLFDVFLGFTKTQR